MTEYVAGFLFDDDLCNVVLIQKEKPAWQKGKLNAVGGKIEPGETPEQAMIREFAEETGMYVSGWQKVVELSGPDFVVHFFRQTVDGRYLDDVRSTTEEQVGIYEVDCLEDYPIIANLAGLVPMAKYTRDVSYKCVEVTSAPSQVKQ